jgi:hypothetical protein
VTKSIALIFHENERQSALPRFAIWHLAEIWRKQNLEVIPLFGVEKYIPADLAILHVDLSEVPEKYMEFSTRYPVALNGLVRNIRKSSFSTSRLDRDDTYHGQVIVKSDLNYAGQPERKLLGTPLSRFALRISCRLPFFRPISKDTIPHFRSPQDYRILDNIHTVPDEWFGLGDVLIERFVPEMQDGFYCLRAYHFLGERGVCFLRKSARPIVNASNTASRVQVEVHPEIVRQAKRMKFDYGKFDYVIHEGEPLLLDANKTPGGSNAPVFFAMCREWAQGIRSYL